MSWRIYYDDGTVFTSDDGKVEAAPLKGVQAVAEKRDGRTILHVGGEFYRWDGYGWRARPVVLDIKRTGTLMDLEEFKRLKARAMEWLNDPAS